MNDPMFQRIRAACCNEHGLANGVSFRSDPKVLDDYAARIVLTVLKLKRENPKAAA